MISYQKYGKLIARWKGFFNFSFWDNLFHWVSLVWDPPWFMTYKQVVDYLTRNNFQLNVTTIDSSLYERERKINVYVHHKNFPSLTKVYKSNGINSGVHSVIIKRNNVNGILGSYYSCIQLFFYDLEQRICIVHQKIILLWLNQSRWCLGSLIEISDQ